MRTANDTNSTNCTNRSRRHSCHSRPFRVIRVRSSELGGMNRISAAEIAILVGSALIYVVQHIQAGEQVFRDDIMSLYAYLPATLIYHDLSFAFADGLPTAVRDNIWWQPVSTGGRVQKMTAGTAVLYAPFFFAAHGIARGL